MPGTGGVHVVLSRVPSALVVALASAGCAAVIGADFDRRGAEAVESDGGDAHPHDGAATNGSSENDGSAGCVTGCSSGGGDSGAPLTSDDASAAGDAGTQACRGTALACAAFSSSSTCAAQAPCSWTTPACSGTPTDCDTNDPSNCSIRPACEWDFNRSHCVGASDGCKVDEATCRARAGCTWGGGCAGTPTACSSLSVSACSTQRGCSVVHL